MMKCGATKLMFVIKSLELTNFRSFVGTNKWDLPTAPGLYFLTGRNDANPRLSRNGAGKSSLLDAISWCLYGRTTNGIRGPDVVNRGSDGCVVRVHLLVGNQDIVAVASQSPNSLTVNGQTVDREALVKLLRLNYESFCYSVILPQGGETFFDLSPANKLALFSQIMELDHWLLLSEKAADEAKAIDSKIIALQRQSATIEGKIDALSLTIDDLMIKSSQWEDLQHNKISNLEQQLLSHSKAVRDLKSEIKELKPFDLSEFDDLIQTINEVDQQRAVIESKINEIKRAQKTVGGKCPMCLQTVGKDHLGQLEKHFSTLRDERNSLMEDRRVLDAEKARIDAVRLEHMASQGESQRRREELRHLEREIAQIQQRIEQITEEKNEFGDLVTSKRNEYDRLQVALTESINQVNNLQEQYTATHYWVAGFKRLRLYIVEEALKSLEIEVNNNLTALGLADWKIQFDIEREKKDGGYSKGFSVIIINPDGDSIRFETFSGGESQLFRLAGALGLSNLICERAGLLNKIEILDEPSSHLSKEAVLSLTELLHQRAIQTERQIFLIDHTAIEYGDFAGVITVVKDEQGSRIEY